MIVYRCNHVAYPSKHVYATRHDATQNDTTLLDAPRRDVTRRDATRRDWQRRDGHMTTNMCLTVHQIMPKYTSLVQVIIAHNIHIKLPPLTTIAIAIHIATTRFNRHPISTQPDRTATTSHHNQQHTPQQLIFHHDT